MEILHAHMREEAITDFSVQSTFTAFTALEQYMQSHRIPMYDSSGFPTGVGHGVLCNIRYPTHTYCGGTTTQQGEQLLAIWSQFHDDYGIFCIAAANLIPFLLLTMPQEIGLLEMYKSLSLPWPTTVVLTVRTQSDHNT